MAEVEGVSEVIETSRQSRENVRPQRETEVERGTISQLPRGWREIEISIPDTSRLEGVLNY
jgi:hypothetical protein